ncbi:hypothetical protein [Corynebacterium striatum]|uniref:hypothetical protein n=1 Tax=Corynebacterium striatum TaxID=43770 RepID=UPI000C1CCA2B|nr:hypothetical protein [Corynebacterium striatum]PIS62799.1 hypothetical protein AZH44_05130 [Corynebacterium striatum]PXY06158.1 hypothetical protein CKF55_09280 [Corynebacterium striatum]PXY06278.1 hypothetical protein CKF72_12860 [Corynebacterium striatum]PXY12354.1 hypothetical protein CKF62_13245 [Corynebacterium striatum]
MTDSLFTSGGYWNIGAETKAAIPQSEFPPNIVEMIDLVTARRFWPYLPHVDLDVMEQHHPGAKVLITDLKRALHNEWDMLGGWTGLWESGQAQRVVARVTAEVEDKDLASFCSGIIEDLFLWAMNDERSAMEGCKVLKEYGVQSPEVLLAFPYDPAGLAVGGLELWHSELRRNYLHWLIQNAVAAEMEENRLPEWQVTGYAAVREWLETL